MSGLPQQPCSFPRTAAAPLTTGGSGQGYKDLKAENKVGSSKGPDGDGWWGEERQLDKARHGKVCQPSPLPESPHAPSHTDGNRKTNGLVPGGTAAATFTATLTASAALSAGSPTTCCRPPTPAPPPLGSWDFPGPTRPHLSCSCLVGWSLL